MSFTSVIVERADATGKKLVTGTYASTNATTGGDVKTELNVIEHFTISGIKSAADVVSGGTVTITTAALESGTWQAYGY